LSISGAGGVEHTSSQNVSVADNHPNLALGFQTILLAIETDIFIFQENCEQVFMIAL
jgi:hypothetical protein